MGSRGWVVFGVGLVLRLALIARFPFIYGGDTVLHLMNRDRILLSHQLPLLQVGLFLVSKISASHVVAQGFVAVIGALAGVGFYLLAGHFLKRSIAFLAALLFASTPFFLALSVVPFQEMLMLTGLLFGFHFFFAGNVGAASVLIGAACFTRYEAWAACPVLAVAYAAGGGRFLVGCAIFGWAPTVWIASHIGLSGAGTYVIEVPRTWRRLERYSYLGWMTVKNTAIPVLALACLGVWRGRMDRRLAVLGSAVVLLLLAVPFSAHGDMPDPERIVSSRETVIPIAAILLLAGMGLETVGRFRGLVTGAGVVLGIWGGYRYVERETSRPEVQLSYRLARYLDHNVGAGERVVILTKPIPRESIQMYLDKVRETGGSVARARERLAEVASTPVDYQRTVVHSRLGTVVLLSGPPKDRCASWLAVWSDFPGGTPPDARSVERLVEHALSVAIYRTPCGADKVSLRKELVMSSTRRHFLKTASVAPGAGMLAAAQTPRSPNDRIQVALIGAGGQGMGDAHSSVAQPGVKLVAVADCYDGRLTRSKELFGADLFTTRDYREILARPDIDAVIIGTPDHWHSKISIEAMTAGKDVYCEKPMVQHVEDGKPVIAAQRKTGRIMQVGSQRVSSVVYQKAKDLLKAGAIGEFNMVEAWWDRNSAIGAWQYSIPPDASTATCDWDGFQGRAKHIPWDAKRFFRWRNYQDYGTGVAGDLFVHLFSGMHFVTGAIGPERVYATGGLRYWKDGRDVPDLLLGVYDYAATDAHPAFNLALRVNFEDGSGETSGFRFIGSEGIMTIGSGVTISKHPGSTEPGYSIDTFPKATQEEFLKEYRKQYPRQRANADAMRADIEDKYLPPSGYSDHLDHHRVFIDAVRSRKPVVEDPTFGFRAAGPALLSNISYFEQRVCKWDPKTMSMA